MRETPVANRKSIVLAGRRNSGKSTLFNRIIGQERSIISHYAGTTTDPVFKSMELIGYGPVRVCDTAGFDDVGELGRLRVEKTENEMESADLIVHVIDVNDILDGIDGEYSAKDIISGAGKIADSYRKRYKELKKEYIFVINKCDLLVKDISDRINSETSSAEMIFLSAGDTDMTKRTGNSIDWYEKFIGMVIEKLDSLEKDRSLVEGLLKKGDTAVLVVPVDSEAPAGRLILPQVQTIRACLDEGIKVVVTRDVELEETLSELRKADLVITDSQVFKEVYSTVPEGIRLTSFSILFARQKGDIDEFVRGAKTIDSLEDGDSVLIAESCTHTVSHEDIGTVKIPGLIRKRTGKDIEFEFSYGPSMPRNLERYALIIQCGGCMVTRGNIMNRIRLAKKSGVSVTNYGVVLSKLTGILDKVVY